MYEKPTRLDLLIIEDSEDDALLVQDELRQGGYDLEWKRVETREEMRQALSEAEWDLIIADYRLPDFTGLDAFAIYREFGLDSPFIIISGTIGEDAAVAAMKAGVHDYLTKGNLARLVPAVGRELREAQVRKQRKRAEEALRQSESELRREREFLDALVRHAPYPIAVVKGHELRYTMTNPAYEALLGPDTRIVGRTHREVFPEAAAAGGERSLLKTIETGEPWIIHDFKAPLPGGPERIWEGRAARLPMTPGEEPSALIIAWDVTELKQAEERLRHTQRLESVGLLAGGVAHDFNNLLTVIIGSASAGLEQCPTCEHSKAILCAAERAAHLSKQLLAYAGKGQFVKKAVHVSDLVARSRELLGASVPKRVDLVFNLAEGLPAVEEDPSRIEQILMNLVINAGEAIPPNFDGRIEIGTGVAEITPNMASQQSRYEIAPGTYVCLEVRDNGAGIEETTISRIFDPFFSTKFTGRGLGLAAVDGIVRSSNGFIVVSSITGGGTTFRVFLPASQKTPVPESEKSDPQLISPRNRSAVLVVDDEEMIRKVTGKILRRRGYEVLEAVDGKDALEVLANSPTLPSVVLLDFAMPVMGGDELVPILAKQYPSLKVVVSSGFPEEVARNGFDANSVAGFVQKPYTAVSLAEKLDEVLGGRPEQSGRLVQFPKSG